MCARREFRDRDDVEVEILDALVDRQETGMTVFELRSHVDADIETLEPALANLRRDELITVTYSEDRSVIRPCDHVVPSSDTYNVDGRLMTWLNWVRRRFRR